MRRAVLLATTLLCSGLSFGCKEEIKEYCDMTTDAPSVKAGNGKATGDPDDLDADASWKPGSGGSLTIGELDLIIEKEESGSDTQGLVEDGAFPICIRLAERGEKTCAGNFVNGGFVTTKDHKGNVALLSNDDDVLVGRFEVDLKNPAGEEMSFTDGVFAAKLR